MVFSLVVLLVLLVSWLTFHLWPFDLRLPSPSSLTAIEYEPHFLPLIPTFSHLIQKNTHLKDHSELFFDSLHGVESVTMGPGSSITLLDCYGYAHIADKVDGSYQLRGSEESAYIGPGRPLGSHYYRSSLIVCDSLKGLIEWDGSKITILTNNVTYANDLDVDDAGIVYFSDSQTTPVSFNPQLGHYDTFGSAMLGLMSGKATGRVLAYDLNERTTSVLAEGLFYANGVSLSKDKDFLLVAETYTMLIKRIWLTAEKRGMMETFIDLTEFGFPDGINRASDGSFWVAILSPRNQRLISTFQSKWSRFFISHLPTWMRPKLARQGLVLKVSQEGQIVTSLWDDKGEVVGGVSAVVEGEEGDIWLGNLQGKGVWRVKV